MEIVNKEIEIYSKKPYLKIADETDKKESPILEHSIDYASVSESDSSVYTNWW